ncbi:inner membrane-spanning protein YciB [Tateyamaria pelophila]|uniref:inner membrane-spanning protein YciB n=1 Tax=Tateyamaria pelophila TaxID=328415 RepID=UPI001CC05B33|nr:inner membrane-spanning protein YciB [Tateyamaria pelophila]
MSDTREINPILKQVLELGPPLVFFLIYLRIRDNSYVMGGTEYSGFIVATLVFVPILLICMAVLWAMTGKLSRMQLFTAFMVVFFGGLTAYFNDERFFKMKTSIVYGVFALLLGIGLLRGQSWLAYVLNEAMPMRDEGWMILTKRLCAMFVALAVLNEVIWRTMSTDTWVKIETFGFPIALIAFLFWQITALQSYLIEDDADKSSDQA